MYNVYMITMYIILYDIITYTPFKTCWVGGWFQKKMSPGRFLFLWDGVHSVLCRSESPIADQRRVQKNIQFWVVPPPRGCGNEGLGWDSLLKMVHNPGADWHPGRGNNPNSILFFLVNINMANHHVIHCWWFRNPQQPPGCIKTSENYEINNQPQLVQVSSINSTSLLPWIGSFHLSGMTEWGEREPFLLGIVGISVVKCLPITWAPGGPSRIHWQPSKISGPSHEKLLESQVVPCNWMPCGGLIIVTYKPTWAMKLCKQHQCHIPRIWGYLEASDVMVSRISDTFCGVMIFVLGYAWVDMWLSL